MGGATRWDYPSRLSEFNYTSDTRVGLQVAGELLDLQKLPATSDGCVFSGLRAGSLYRLQVVSWSRDMSSDSATLARTGQSTRHVKPCCTAPWWINVAVQLIDL